MSESIRVQLVAFDSVLMSRAEAKRVLNNRSLIGFQEIVLDFAGIDQVGQGFVDELFRVAASQNPGVKFTAVGMDPGSDVAFMVHRGTPRE